jgi:glutaredoxin
MNELLALQSFCPYVFLNITCLLGQDDENLVSRYSRRAKELLDSYDIHPSPKVLEVDLRGILTFSVISDASLTILTDDSNTIKAILTRLTRRSTFPNIIVRGRSIGGSDDIHELHAQKTFRKLLEEAGAVPQNDSAGK